MRTTLDIADDVLIAAKEIGRRERKTTGTVISELARRALIQGSAPAGRPLPELPAFYDIEPLPARSVVVTNDLINRLRNAAGD